MDQLVHERIIANGEKMKAQVLKRNLKPQPALELGDTVRIQSSALKQVRKYGAMTARSKKRKAQLFNYTK